MNTACMVLVASVNSWWRCTATRNLLLIKSF